MFVTQVEVSMGICGAGAAIVEYYLVGSRGNTFFPRAIDGLEGEPAEGHGGQRASHLVVVRMKGEAVVGFWRVEVCEEETVVPAAAVKGPGNQEFEFLHSTPVADVSFIAVE
jgi:hypothetical protein